VLTVHRAASGDVLVRALADVLAEPPEDPFAADIVAVPAKGVERWIAQRLAHVLGADDGDGVCANVTFPWPSRMLDEALQSASAEHADTFEKWAPARLTWPLLDVLEASTGEAWCAALTAHLGPADDDRGRRVSVAGRLASSFDQYGQARPAMLRAWAEGRDEAGDGTPLDDDLRWQAELWRRLRTHLGTPAPAEVLETACARLRAERAASDLPSRLSVFGASRLSPARLMVLAALAEHRAVHLWLHHPSPALWAAVAKADPAVLRRADDSTRHALRHPLLESMARDLLELQHLVRRCAPGAADGRAPLAESATHPARPAQGRPRR
jgi:exodeoxyribonuclease V gamma subunit